VSESKPEGVITKFLVTRVSMEEGVVTKFLVSQQLRFSCGATLVIDSGHITHRTCSIC